MTAYRYRDSFCIILYINISESENLRMSGKTQENER